jgi:SNF2 family DNA or RNA helicase
MGKVLLIAPLRVCYSVWPREIKKWNDFKHLKIEILHGPKKDEALAREADIYVINPEGLEWLLDVEKTKTTRGKTKVAVDLRRWKSLGFTDLVIDELSKFKHPSSGRFKSLKMVLHTFQRRWGLTGSPAANGLMDLFGQAYILDQGRSLGQYITNFRMKYFRTVDKNGFIWVPQEGAEDEIYERLAPLALRMSADDYLDMPKIIENNIKLDLPADVREFYDHMEEDLIAGIDTNTVVAKTAADASLKCRQISNGGIYLTPDVVATGFKILKQKREWADLHTVKVDALADLIEELQGQPILIAYDFQHDLERLKAKFGKDIPVLGGGGKAKDTDKIISAWNRGELPYIFAHPQSAAHGLDGLQHVGRHVAFHSMTFNFELYDQFIRRVLRQGNKAESVFVHHFIMRDTIDEAMLWALKSKHRGQQALFDALKQMSKSRRRKI